VQIYAIYFVLIQYAPCIKGLTSPTHSSRIVFDFTNDAVVNPDLVSPIYRNSDCSTQHRSLKKAMEIIAAIFVGIILIAVAAGISWLALRVFFFAMRRGLTPALERERVGDRTELIEEVRRLRGLAPQW
jgi:hypothetical protein